MLIVDFANFEHVPQNNVNQGGHPSHEFRFWLRLVWDPEVSSPKGATSLLYIVGVSAIVLCKMSLKEKVMLVLFDVAENEGAQGLR